MLATNMIRKDLQSSNLYESSVALTGNSDFNHHITRFHFKNAEFKHLKKTKISSPTIRNNISSDMSFLLFCVYGNP